jgi:Concanavalin A-like lectin/glucanases superfamily/Bacterial Ig domain
MPRSQAIYHSLFAVRRVAPASRAFTAVALALASLIVCRPAAAQNHAPIAQVGGTPTTAVTLDDIGDELRRTTGLPPITNFTMMGWFRITGDNHTYSTLLGLSHATSNAAYLTMMCCGNGWRQLSVWNGGGMVSGSNLTLGTWYHVAMTVEGSGPGQLKVYLNGALDITANGNPGIPAERLSIGNDSYRDWMQGEAASVKVYNVALTPAEIAQEMTSYVPLRTADLNSWYPLRTAADAPFDYSGNVGSLTVAGTLATVAGPPLASGTAFVTPLDTAFTATLQATDPDGDPLTYAVVTSPSKGTVILNPTTGAFTYTPLSGSSGVDTFTFKASDGLLDSNIATITVLITPSSVQKPFAANATLTTSMNLAASGTLVASDPANLPLTYAIVTNGTLGTATITNAATGAFTYTPFPGLMGTDSFTFQVSNGTRLSNVATVTVTITPPVNHAPVAQPVGTTSVVSFDGIGDELRRTTNLPPITNFTMMGWFRVRNDNQQSYQTFLGLSHTTSSNAYLIQMCCGNGWRQLAVWTGAGGTMGSSLSLGTWYHVALSVSGSGPGQVKAYLNGVLDITIDGNPAVTAERFSIANDSHYEWVDGDAADVKVYNVALTAAEIAQEMIKYAPVRTADLNSWYPLAIAADAPFDYSGNARTMSAAGALTTDVPGPPGISAIITPEATPVTGTLHATDIDGDPLTYSLVKTTSSGTITLDSVSGAFTYTPLSGAVGVDSFSFKASDSVLDSNIVTVTLLVTPNRVPPPVAANGSLTTSMNIAAAGTLVATDPTNLPLTYTIVTNGTNGSATITNTATGAYVYTPKTGVTGTDSFTFRANNGTRDSNIATITVTITPPVNHAPVAKPLGTATSAAGFDQSGDELRRTTNLPPITSFTMMGWFRLTGDNHPYSTLLALTHSTSSNGYVVQLCCGNGWDQLEGWTGASSALGSKLTLGTWYHVAMTVSGSGPGQFRVYLNGALDMTLDGNPAATAERLSIGNDSHREWMDGNASDVKLYNVALTPGEIAQEMMQYAPVRTAGLDSWYPLRSATDAVTDYSGNAGTLTLAGSLTTVAGPPLAATLVTTRNTPVSGTMQATDIDGDPLTFAIVASPSKGTIGLNATTGAFTYTSQRGVIGIDTFSFKASDGRLDSNIVTVTVVITQ